MHKNLQLFYVLIAVTLLALGARWYLNRGDHANLNTEEAAAFAISDTSMVTRIVIADKDGFTADLRREHGQRYWSLNNRHSARKDAVELLLKTFRRVAVKGPVPQSERPTVMRMLAGRAKKVEIFLQGSASPVKTWYIGTATSNHTGTYMLLETKNGMAEEPFIVHMEGFTGFLSTRFFTDEREWRYTGVFDHPGRSLAKAECIFHEQPSESWALTADLNGSLALATPQGQTLAYADTVGVQDLFLRYRKVHLETYNHHLTPEGLDSMKTQAEPAFTLRTWAANESEPDSIQLFWKSPAVVEYDEQGQPKPWDGSRMYGLVNGDEVVLVQRFVFDPLLLPLSAMAR